MNLSIDDFDYELPPELIAQHPSESRSGSRLLGLRGETLSDHRFSDLPQLLSPGDLLVFNDTKVIKARLVRKEGHGRPHRSADRAPAARGRGARPGPRGPRREAGRHA